MSEATRVERTPHFNVEPPVFELIIEDIRARAAIGRERYGTYLQPFNLRNAMVDMYQEDLDRLNYLRQIMFEVDEVRTACLEVYRAYEAKELGLAFPYPPEEGEGWNDAVGEFHEYEDIVTAMNVLRKFALIPDSDS